MWKGGGVGVINRARKVHVHVHVMGGSEGGGSKGGDWQLRES